MLDSVTEELREIGRVVSESGILLGSTRNHIRAPSVQCQRENIETPKAQIPRTTARSVRWRRAAARHHQVSRVRRPGYLRTTYKDTEGKDGGLVQPWTRRRASGTGSN
jgi:hypothetical protein